MLNPEYLEFWKTIALIFGGCVLGLYVQLFALYVVLLNILFELRKKK